MSVFSCVPILEYVYLLSGNQLNQVCEHYYPLSSVLGYRLPVRAFAGSP
jgi:hypothetical protein